MSTGSNYVGGAACIICGCNFPGAHYSFCGVLGTVTREEFENLKQRVGKLEASNSEKGDRK